MKKAAVILWVCLLCLCLGARADIYTDMALTSRGLYYLAEDDLGRARLLLEGADLGDAPENTTLLVTRGDDLWALDQTSGLFFPIEGEGEAITLEMSTGSTLQSAVVLGENLYLTYYSYDEKGVGGAHLGRWSLKTGKGEVLPVASPSCAVAGPGNTLILITGPAYREVDESWYVPAGDEITRYDPADGTFTALAALDGFSPSGLACDTATGLICWLSQGRVMGFYPGEKPRALAWAPCDGSWYMNAQGFIVNNVYYNYDEGGPYSRALDGEAAERLTVYGLTYDKGAQLFARQYPQTPLSQGEGWFTGSQLLMALSSARTAPDAVRLYSAQDLNALMEANLLADLSQHPGVQAMFEKLTPQFQAAVSREGKIYALPLSLEGWGLAYDPQVLSAMGLTEKDLPRTWEEMFLFLTRWSRQWPDSDYVPMHPYGLRSSLYYSVLNAYEDAMAASGQPLTFDTPLFTRLMKGLMEADLSAIEIDISADNLKSKTPLFLEYSVANLLTRWDLVPWPLALDASTPAPVGVELTCLAVPVHTSQPLAAARLTDAYLEAMEPAVKALFCPDAARPLTDPLHEERLEMLTQRLEDLKARQAREDIDLDRDVAALESRLPLTEESRYILSPARLTFLRESLSPRLYLRTDLSLLDASQDDATGFLTLEQRFLEGEISPSQFVGEMERKLRIARMALQ